MKPRVLFVLKFRESSGGDYTHCWSKSDEVIVGEKKELSSGLLNSARFVVDILEKDGIEVKLVQVVDNNDIDREVTLYKPTHVIIEALWVVPTKFDVLQRLHPNVQWIVRGHSELPFIAQEGVAIEWITRYVLYENVRFAANSENSVKDIRAIIQAGHPEWSTEKVREKVPYLPNYYPYYLKTSFHKKEAHSDFIDIACFGAVRPLKNQLIQAVAAIEYATLLGKKLRFHTNATRVETQGDPVLRNLEALFEATPPHELIKHPWMPHEEFLELLKLMDISLCVSFSESFCIIAADSIIAGVPIVGSSEIEFLTSWSQAATTDSDDIVMKMLKTRDWILLLKVLNYRGLKSHCEKAKKLWLAQLT